MRQIPFLALAVLIYSFLFFSCKKIEQQQTPTNSDSVSAKKSARLTASTSGTYPIVSADYIPEDDDSIERETVLGVQLTNPYLIPNMQQAYADLGLSTAYAVVNNLYVRFLPSNIDQLVTLDSTMDAQGLELFDTPVDYQVLYEGDYYQDPSIPDSMITWQYAVVPPSFQFPAGIQYETLASIHIPSDSYTAVETEAERLASIQDSINMSSNNNTMTMNTVTPYSNTKNGKVNPYVLQCGEGYQWSYTLNKCVPILCPPGSHLEGSLCVADNPPVLDPPPAAPDAHIPAGNIYVFDTNLPSIGNGSPFGLRKVKVIAKRWFKIQTTYTDASGHFTFTKHFKNKVKIKEQFINSDATIFGMRRANIWQMVFPIKRTLGIYNSSDMSNIQFPNNQEGPINSKANRYWAAATVENAAQEHLDYATQFGFSKMPNNMHIFLTPWATQEGSGSTPMFGHGVVPGISGEAAFTEYYLMSKFRFSPVLTDAVAAIGFRLGLDMSIDYNPPSWRDQFYSDYLMGLCYHEMSHASDFSKVGLSWYQNFVSAELSESIIHGASNDPLNPYGDSNSVDAPIIALGEAWAYHMGHFLADQRYGLNSYDEFEGQLGYGNTPNAHTDIEVLENWNPNYTDDVFNWIPKGLMEDMIDNTNENFPVIDGINGFTISQLFAALQNDVRTVQQYKELLITQNPGSATQINNIFAQYHF
jgi:hypothetical protein